MPEFCFEIRHAILAKFHKQFFSNFSVLAKRLGFEAFASGKFCSKCIAEAATGFLFFHAWELPISVATTVLAQERSSECCEFVLPA